MELSGLIGPLNPTQQSNLVSSGHARLCAPGFAPRSLKFSDRFSLCQRLGSAQVFSHLNINYGVFQLQF